MLVKILSRVALASMFASFAIPAAAQESPAPAMGGDMAPVKCSEAGSAMTAMMKSPATAPAMTGDMDKDFSAIASAKQKEMVDMMKIEARCGKDPKMKAMAQKYVEDPTVIRIVRGLYGF